MTNFKDEHKTSQTQRDRVKHYEAKIRENEPEKYKKRLEYHKKYYKEMKDALKMQQMMYINTHDIIMD